jgi:1-acylglycerone phosphate reductase
VFSCTPGGIGFAVAEEFKRRGMSKDDFRSRIGRLINPIGFKVIATARSEAVVEHLASLGYHAVQLDVTDAASIDRCREIVVGLTGGRLDILMNNAQVPPTQPSKHEIQPKTNRPRNSGRGLVLPATDSPIDEIRSVYETNVFAVMAMTRSFIDLLIPARGLIIIRIWLDLRLEQSCSLLVLALSAPGTEAFRRARASSHGGSSPQQHQRQHCQD